ncbi:outer membrane protein [Helicobacter cetorum]|uniref:Outer membrane protein 4 n=1 Tax=Helicobacter cetorum (strain ATCC BAA-540 / CCUG 52418 / MIT 99-5656) TaxID=1163745 RepID=I0EUG4_HELCM|nr:outer membrane protein [Helicobacter cetorum]AFI06583.1 outer membrane protein 4 [Helicobacter cetorum MIT 99-5656]
MKIFKTINKAFVASALSLALAQATELNENSKKPKLADRNAFYLGVGYQLSAINATFSNKFVSTTHYMVGNGVGVVLGGKFVAQRQNLEHVGLRYGVFYDQTFSSYKSYISTYGLEFSALWDAVNSPKRFFGLEFGLGIAGATYMPGNALNGVIAKDLGKQNSLFQLLVNVGMRFGSLHNEIALGLKFPTIPDVKNQTINGLSATTLWHRLPVAYVNYIYNF